MSKMKKIVALMTVIVVIFSLSTTVFALPTFTPEFEVKSETAILINTDTDTIIYEKDKDKAMSPASLVKIMTVIIALEKVPDLEVVVEANSRVFDDIYGKNASNADIRPFEQVRMIDLLYATMLQSACEGAGIIADYVSGGNQLKFVDMMNEKAKEIGAVNTMFVDPHGLDDDTQYTTAYDMYLITKYAMTLPLFEQIATAVVYEMPATNKHANPRKVYHTNFMLSKNLGGSYYDPTVKGIKTGTTGKGTKNLATISSSNGFNYMLIVLGAPIHKDDAGNTVQNTYLDTKSIYRWAYETFDMVNVVDTSYMAKEVEVELAVSNKNHVIVVPEKVFSAFLPADIDLTTVQKIPTVNENVEAPVNKGDILGSLELKLGEEILGTVPLIASENIERSTFLYTMKKIKEFFSNVYVQIAAVLIIILILGYIVYSIFYNHKKKSSKDDIFSGKKHKKKRR